MVDQLPWVHLREEMPANNDSMVEELINSGAMRRSDCIAAFRAIDRKHFWPSDGTRLAYADMPLRCGILHLSAPHIYTKALESLLPIRPGMSFLNVGSGTGYFNSLVSELIGPLATNHGVEIWPETVAHAERCCGAIGKHNIRFTVGNIYNLDVSTTGRYDRIYFGACANSRSKYLYRLLEVGGVLVAPFQVGHQQQLRRVFRQSERQFNVEVLGSVQFASLIEPAPDPVPTTTFPGLGFSGGASEEGNPISSSSSTDDSDISMADEDSDGSTSFVGPARDSTNPVVAPRPTEAFPFSPPSRRPGREDPRTGTPPGADAAASLTDGSSPMQQLTDEGGPVGLVGVPFTFSLSEAPWCPERCWLYPASFRQVVFLGLASRPQSPSAAWLPSEVWIKHLLPWCPRWWFESRALHAAPTLSAEDSAAPTPRSISGELVKASDDVARSPKATHVDDTYLFNSDSDGGSTRATSSGPRSTQLTPIAGPSEPPASLVVPGAEGGATSVGVPRMVPLPAVDTSPDGDGAGGDSSPMDVSVSAEEDAPSQSTLFEVFDAGQRHAIGTGDDPDDADPDDQESRMPLPFQVLQALVRRNDGLQRRRRREENEGERHGVGRPAWRRRHGASFEAHGRRDEAEADDAAIEAALRGYADGAASASSAASDSEMTSGDEELLAAIDAAVGDGENYTEVDPMEEMALL